MTRRLHFWVAFVVAGAAIAMWTPSALANDSHYTAIPAATDFAFGGPPYCYYHVALHLNSLEVTIGAQGVATSGQAEITLNEDASFCPFRPLGTKLLRFTLANGECGTTGCQLSLSPSSSNEPRTTASFVGNPDGTSYRGTLTLTRIDSAASLNWTAQLSTVLVRS